ncbi:MAG: DUF3710 domain-containing protein [Pseudonocardia sp.]|nr:DUF3710 domain-containing protein [Pseudonocardia sp.]
MSGGRNGVPTSAELAQGPFDVDDADPGMSAAPGVLDFGALRVPSPPGGAVGVQPGSDGRMQAVQITLPGGRLSVSALAAPRSSKLWPQLVKEIESSLREGGAQVRSFTGEWGRELHATTGAAGSVFVGVDGPRWMVYGVATGPTSHSADLEAELRRMLRATVVVRGKSPYPVRTVLPLTAPETIAGQAPAEALPDADPEGGDGLAPLTEPILTTAAVTADSPVGPRTDEDAGIDVVYGWNRQTAPPPAVPPPTGPPPTGPRRADPFDPLDPAAPVDTRWLDEPGVTTAWDAVVAARRPPAAPDWSEWARTELDRALAERAAREAADKPTAASILERLGVEQPVTGGRSARRHGTEAGAAPREGRVDPFTARRRAREAVRGRDPDGAGEVSGIAPSRKAGSTRRPDACAWAGGWPGAAAGPAVEQTRRPGRRHADAPGGAGRLSVAELAERARLDRAQRRGRHHRPGPDSPTRPN